MHGSASNQESTANILLKFRKETPNCFNMIVLSFDKKGGAVEFKIQGCHLTIRVFSALDKTNMAQIVAKRMKSQKEISVWFGYLLSRDSSLPSINSRPFWRKSNESHIARLPSDFAEHIHHVGSSRDMHSIIKSGLMGGKHVKKGRLTVFFTATNPMFAHLHKQRDYDVKKPRVAVHKQSWEITSEFESCSEGGVDVPPNKIQRDHPSQHSPSNLH